MRASSLGCPIDILSMAETIELACVAMRTRQRVQHVALNAAKFVNIRLDPCSSSMSPAATSLALMEWASFGPCGRLACRSRRGSAVSICWRSFSRPAKGRVSDLVPLAERRHLDVIDTRGIWQDMPVRT
jgi:hypothetical protein